MTLLTGCPARGEKTTGPLRVHPTNPRYFADGSGKVIYLTGSHNWNNFQDDTKRVFPWAAYLDFLVDHNHNFIRLWVHDTAWGPVDGKHVEGYVEPQPYVRTGPGNAIDGKPKFDLTKLNQSYFDRLRRRVIEARDRGLYVGVMLFDVWGVGGYGNLDEWRGNPFNVSNNVNGVNGDSDADGMGGEIHCLGNAQITSLQDAYVRKVVDTLNDLDNVLFEIANESAIDLPAARDWQYHMINLIHDYELTKPKRHPVGTTYGGTDPTLAQASLFASPGEWVAVGGLVGTSTAAYGEEPPAADGRKVVIADTDHIPLPRDSEDPWLPAIWVWKSFTRGLNPIYMDPLEALTGGYHRDSPGDENARRAMGHTHTLAGRMNLAAMMPRNDLASTEYCLADPGKEYLVYLPDGGEVTVDLSAASGTLAVEWLHPVEGATTPGDAVAGGEKRTLRAPFEGDAVVRIWRR